MKIKGSDIYSAILPEQSEKVTHFDMKMGLKTACQLHPRAAKTAIWPGGPCYYSAAQRARNDAILRSARKWSAARVRIPCDHLDQNLIESLQQPWHLHNQWCATHRPTESSETRHAIKSRGNKPWAFFPAREQIDNFVSSPKSGSAPSAAEKVRSYLRWWECERKESAFITLRRRIVCTFWSLQQQSGCVGARTPFHRQILRWASSKFFARYPEILNLIMWYGSRAAERELFVNLLPEGCQSKH